MMAQAMQGADGASIPTWIVCIVGAYLVGAIPTGFLIARCKGIDIRTVGSGNIGATNVLRSVGKGWGIITLILDALKGFIPAFVFPHVVQASDSLPSPALGLACACVAVMGHNWPIFLGFKGGKGIATSAGALLGVVPECVGIAFIAWIIVFCASRYVSLASITATIALVAWAWREEGAAHAWLPSVLTVLGAVAIWRHRDNIGRLAGGTENRIDLKKRGQNEA